MKNNEKIMNNNEKTMETYSHEGKEIYRIVRNERTYEYSFQIPLKKSYKTLAVSESAKFEKERNKYEQKEK